MSFGEILILPEKYVYKKDLELYKKTKDNPAEWQKYFKWWNLHEIMDTFHDGLIPTENSANYFNFKIDFTAPELQKASQDDPELVNKVSVGMSKLNNLTNDIQNYITNIKEQNASNIQQGVLGSIQARRGGKKIKKGGQMPPNANMPMPNANMPMPNANMPMPNANMPNANMPMPNANMPMPNANMPNANMPNANMPNANMQMPNAPPQKPFSSERIQAECFSDLLDVGLTTRNRIFILSKDLVPYTKAPQGGRKTKKKNARKTARKGGARKGGARKRKTRKHSH